MASAASLSAGPALRCDYIGAVSCEREEAIWSPFLWELCDRPENAEIAFAWSDVQTGSELGTVVCGLNGSGPSPPLLDDDHSGSEQAPEECEVENTHELEIWDAIQANLGKLDDLVSVEQLTSD